MCAAVRKSYRVIFTYTAAIFVSQNNAALVPQTKLNSFLVFLFQEICIAPGHHRQQNQPELSVSEVADLSKLIDTPEKQLVPLGCPWLFWS